MILRKFPLSAAARGLWITFCALTSFYALLCFIPFTWTNFIRDQRYPLWVAWFLRAHTGLFFAAIILGSTALKPGPRRGIYYGILSAVAAALFFAKSPASWGSNELSWIASLLAWGPYLLWETFVYRDSTDSELPPFSAAPEAPVRAPASYGLAACAAALWCWAAATGAHVLAFPPAGSDGRGLGIALAANFFAHLVLFLIAALVIEAWQWAGRLRIFAVAAAVAMLAMLIQSLVLESLDFRGWRAALSAAALAGVLVLACVRAGTGAAVRRWGQKAWIRWAILAILFILPWGVPRALGGLDWNRLIETLARLLMWAGALAIFSAWLEGKWRAPAAGLILLGSLGLSQAVQATWRGPRAQAVIRAWAEEELSFRTARRFLRRADKDGAFYSYLQSHTNLPRDQKIAAKAVPFAVPGRPGRASPVAGKPATPRPHLFIFVIDSLRPDYLGAYNPKVRFTPHLDAFARESLVFRRAFTVYGATGLSEPSIWAGAHLLHKQYVTPFHSLNRLEQLITEEGYRRYITQDVILTELLLPATTTDPLDKHTSGNYKWAATLEELTQKLQALPAAHAPVFAYTQPQDIHISVLEREKAPVPADSRWEGFHAPYAARIAEFDAAFGRFVAALKKQGLYDNSVIVFTSDHGDSLGEGGRWGHAYTIYPEVLRVPLVMHLPERLKENRYWDLEAAAYLIDITPTLYELLGRRMIDTQPLIGRTLLARSKEEFLKNRPAERIAVSSYGPVYGVLADDGRRLSIIDAVQYAAYEFDFRSDPAAASRPLTGDAWVHARETIRRHIERLNAAYR